MIRNNKGASEAGMAHTTTTEELIVQYLDGELVRKELESVLFDRLAKSDEARALLREYLVVRGAIRQSAADERFQLSSDLDGRTRERLEQMFERIAAEGFDVVFPATGTEAALQFLADRPPIASDPFARRLNRWALRPSLALLALLFAIGTTWFLTRTTDNHSAHELAQATKSVAVESDLTQVPTSVAPTSSALPAVAKVPIERSRVVGRKFAATGSQSASVTSSVRASAVKQQSPAAQPASEDIMISDRFGKAIEAAGKHEVIISSRDRL